MTETALMSRDEVRSFEGKLRQFGDSLTPKEQALLAMILTRAAQGGDDDVEGHAFGLPNWQQVKGALGAMLESMAVLAPPEGMAGF